MLDYAKEETKEIGLSLQPVARLLGTLRYISVFVNCYREYHCQYIKILTVCLSVCLSVCLCVTEVGCSWGGTRL